MLAASTVRESQTFICTFDILINRRLRLKPMTVRIRCHLGTCAASPCFPPEPSHTMVGKTKQDQKLQSGRVKEVDTQQNGTHATATVGTAHPTTTIATTGAARRRRAQPPADRRYLHCGAAGDPEQWKCTFCHRPPDRCQTRVSSECSVIGIPFLVKA